MEEKNGETKKKNSLNAITLNGMSQTQKIAKLVGYIKDNKAEHFSILFNHLSDEQRLFVCEKWQNDERYTMLHLATERAIIEIVRLILTQLKKADESENTGGNGQKLKLLIDTRNQWGQTALQISVRQNSLPIALLLLENGANCNIGEYNNSNPMYHAIHKNNVEMMKALMKHGFEFEKLINQYCQDDQHAFHAGCQSKSLDAIKYLFEIEKNILDSKMKNNEDNKDNSGGVNSSETGNSERIVDIFAPCKKYWLPNAFFLSVWEAHDYETVKFLVEDLEMLNKCPYDILNQEARAGFSPFWGACEKHNLDIMKLLYYAPKRGLSKYPLNINCGALHRLCRLGHIEELEWFLNTLDDKKDYDINALSRAYQASYMTPLMEAVCAKQSRAASMLCNDKQAFFHSVANGIDSIKLHGKKNALDLAVEHGAANCFAILMQALIKDKNINDWQQLIKQEIINVNKIDDWIAIAQTSTNPTLKMEYLLSQLKSNLFGASGTASAAKDNANESWNEKYVLLKVILGSYHRDDKNENIPESVLRSANDFEQLSIICDNIINRCDKETLSSFVHCINGMIESKLPINDTLLMLSCKYNKLKFQKSLFTTIKDSLDFDKKQSVGGAWFRNFVVFSQVLACESVDSQNNNTTSIRSVSDLATEADGNAYDEKQVPVPSNAPTSDPSHSDIDSSQLIFDQISIEIINKELDKQKNYLKKEMDQLVKEKDEYFLKLLKYKSHQHTQVQHHIKQNHFVHEAGYGNFLGEPYGVQCDQSQGNLITDFVSGFNGSVEYDQHNYLNELLINAIKMNPSFQKDCKKLFSSSVFGIPCSFKAAPVKTKNRCQKKASLEYDHKPWPHTSSILDILRCSVVFNTTKDMYNGLIKFIQIIGDDGGHFEQNYDKTFVELKGGLFSIVRIKNGFSDLDVKNWKLANDYRYCDIKANIIVEYDKKRMIAEVQFIAKFMLNAKKKGHKYYNFLRNQTLYHQIKSVVNDSDNYQYQFERLRMIIITKDYTQLSQYVLFGKLDKIIHYFDNKNKNKNSNLNGSVNVVQQLLSLCDLSDWTKGKDLLKDATN